MKNIKSQKGFYECIMPKIKYMGNQAQVKPIYWAIFWSTKVIIVFLMIIFILHEFTDVLDGIWIF
ncbi:hypothetical protein MmiEs2_02640 [Methanimicrococcus stummii]|uniref:Uncharacterized protein n=2 Tax=Methanimicrococcus stummii TaxID=3028294 RepID=A0AA96VA45_9EURY|nr:hypothetical protein MmiEs2_02640 [Methanimicrococcus sp. Es2]